MSKNFKLSSLAALGLIAGSMGTAHAACKPPSASEMQSVNSQLDSRHQKMLKSMSCEGQKLAVHMINQTCAGKNACKGQGACKSENNDCAGKNACKGQANGPFTDKNQAVELAHKRMQAMSQ